MNRIARVMSLSAAIAVGACTTGQTATPSLQPGPTASPSATAQPSATTQASATPLPPSSSSPRALWEGQVPAGTYFVTPFLGDDPSICGPAPTRATPPPCPEATSDDSIRFTFTVPDGWAGAPFQGLWLASGGNAPPAGAGMLFNRGYWLYSDPCRTPDNVASLPDIPVGPTVDAFANALAEHPLLEVTTPVDVTLAGYAGKYVDLQVPADISACDVYWPWEGGGGIYAQGPSHQWHLWILDVEGVRVVVQATDYPATSAQHQSELQAIVDSIQITP